jgi:hypothetical protein
LFAHILNEDTALWFVTLFGENSGFCFIADEVFKVSDVARFLTLALLIETVLHKFVIQHWSTNVFIFTLALHLVFKVRDDSPVWKFWNLSRSTFEITCVSTDHTECLAVGLTETQVT